MNSFSMVISLIPSFQGLKREKQKNYGNFNSNLVLHKSELLIFQHFLFIIYLFLFCFGWVGWGDAPFPVYSPWHDESIQQVH